MSGENRNTSTPAKGNTPAPVNPDHSSKQQNKEATKHGAPTTPDHEQGREHTPNVDAHKEGADARRPSEQAHKVSEASDPAQKPSTDADGETGNAERTMAEGQHDRHVGNGPAKHAVSDNSSHKG